MNSPLMTPTFETATRFTQAREGRQFGLAAKALAICILLLGLSPFVSWASEPVNINLASAEVFCGELAGRWSCEGASRRRVPGGAWTV